MKRALFVLALVFAAGAAQAGTLYVSTTGAATNSGSRDTDVAALSGSAAYTLTTSTNILYLDGSPDLSGVVTSGASQDTVYFSTAENSNQLIFWITAKDDTADTVTVSVNISQAVSMSSGTWTIGGRHVLTNAAIEGALVAGSTVVFNNSPASAAGTRWTFRNSGTNAAGPVTIMGASGTRPQLITTDTSVVVSVGSIQNARITNLELIQQGASGNVVTGSGDGMILSGVKISDGGSSGVNYSGSCIIKNSEFSGLGAAGILTSGSPALISGNYSHDNATIGVGLAGSGGGWSIINNVVDTNGTNGLSFTGSVAAFIKAFIFGNTVYGSGQNGLFASDGGGTGNDFQMVLMNNIFLDNGDAGTEYNLNWNSGNADFLSVGSNNIFSIAGARGGGNVSGYSLDSTDLTSDPLLTDPANGDFSLGALSPARAAAYPGAFLGGPTGYMDVGAVQSEDGTTGTPSTSSGDGSSGFPLLDTPFWRR